MSLLQSRTHLDEHGSPIEGDAEAIARYDQAVDALLRFDPSVVEHATVLNEQHADLAMGHALVAYLHLMSTELGDVEVAKACVQAMSAIPMGPREEGHRDAISAWIRGDWHGAAQRLDDVLVQWPADLLALQNGHSLDFFVGDAANLRDRPGRSLAALDPAHPHRGFVLGMQAFGLEESGHYEAAEAAGMAALATNPDDVWALHAVVHTHEMRGNVATGIALLREREPDWGEGNLFTTHNWWHLALFHLEQGDLAEVLAIYDAQVHTPESAGVALEMLDASAMLWRLHLDGHDTGDRFATISDAWAAKDASPWYAFNDLHAVVAYTGAGRTADAAKVVSRLEALVAEGQGSSNLAMTAEVGLPAAKAIVAFGEGRWDDVVDGLAPLRRTSQRFGGSHAQRDLLQRTLLEAAIRGGRADLARSLVAERLALRPTSAYAAAQSARLG
jgi:tetratricopeptide (TPR) repeat protein